MGCESESEWVDVASDWCWLRLVWWLVMTCVMSWSWKFFYLFRLVFRAVRAARAVLRFQEGSLQLQAMGFDGSEAKKALEARPSIASVWKSATCDDMRRHATTCDDMRRHASLPGHFWQCRCSGSFALWLSLKAVNVVLRLGFCMSKQTPSVLAFGNDLLTRFEFDLLFRRLPNACRDTFCAGTAMCRMSLKNEHWGHWGHWGRWGECNVRIMARVWRSPLNDLHCSISSACLSTSTYESYESWSWKSIQLA